MNLWWTLIFAGMMCMVAIVGLGVISAMRITRAWERNWIEAARLLGLAYNKRERRIVGILGAAPISVFFEAVKDDGGRRRRFRTIAVADCEPGWEKLSGFFAAPRGLGKNIPAHIREKAFLTGDERFDPLFISAGEPETLARGCLNAMAVEALMRLILGTLRFDHGAMFCEVEDRVVAPAHLTAMAMAAAGAAQGLMDSLKNL